MRKKFLAGVGVLTLASSMLLVAALPASAAMLELGHGYAPTDNPLVPWQIPAEYPEICEDPEISVLYGAPDEDDFEPIESSAVLIDSSNTAGSFDMSQLEVGSYQINILCENDDFSYSADFDFARYTVVKEVEGDAPADAVFGFEVTANPVFDNIPSATFEFELAAGESKSFYDFDITAWSAEEVDNGGAEEVLVGDTEFISDFDPDAEATVTFTNVFPDADPEVLDPQPEPKPKPAPQPTPVKESDDAPAAKPAKAQPSFTG